MTRNIEWRVLEYELGCLYSRLQLFNFSGGEARKEEGVPMMGDTMILPCQNSSNES